MKKFPTGLLSWAGHRQGGVRRLLQDASGNPGQTVIKTHLVNRLDAWAREVVLDQSVPRALILVGGPGNGKTEALEHLLKQLDESFDAKEAFVDAVRSQVLLPTGYLARKVCLALAPLGLSKPLQAGISHVEVVQDATSSAEPGRSGLRPEELLAADLASVLASDSGIYVAAVNRGILASTLALAHERKEELAEVIPLVEKITLATTISASSPSSWPLEGYPSIAVWAMDVESLFEEVDEKTTPPARQLFQAVLDPARWEDHQGCSAKDFCPFRINHDALSDPVKLGNLLEILRYSELQLGKRWSFRDLFSLLANIIVGHEGDFHVNGVELSPCEWARENVRNLALGGQKKVSSAFNLSMRLYHHALFPAWPTGKDFFPNGEVKKLLTGSSGDDYSPAHLFRVLDEIWAIDPPTELRKTIKNDILPCLDPSLAIVDLVVDECQVTISDIEEGFCFSVAVGFDLAKGSLYSPEKAFIEWLIESERTLDESVVKKTMIKEAAQLKATLRGIASRLTKRSLGLKLGYCKNHEIFEEYRQCEQDEERLLTIAQVFSELINPGNFQVSLKATFGQPVPSKKNDILLETNRVNVDYIKPERESDRPYLGLPYLALNGELKIPLIFTFYQALKVIDQGLCKGCLPSETLALVEGTKARLAGLLINQRIKMQGAKIRLGDTGYELKITPGKIRAVEVGA